MARDRLTAKQEAYALARIAGKGPSDAYRSAYDAGKMSPAVVSVKAAELERHGNIAVAIAEARRRAEEEALGTREWALRTLREASDRSMQAGALWDPRAAVAAINSMAKMQGWNAHEKQDVAISGKVKIRVEYADADR